MDKIHKDAALVMLSFLDFRSFVATWLVCKRWQDYCTQYVLLGTYRGYRTRSADKCSPLARLIKEFTCFCDLRDWNIRNGCSCWRQCCTCSRKSPHWIECKALNGRDRYLCRYGCVYGLGCVLCDISRQRLISQANRSKFRIMVRVAQYHFLVCTDCLRRRRYPVTDRGTCFIWPVSKGFIAWRLLDICLRSDRSVDDWHLNYKKIRDKEYIEMFRSELGARDPDNPYLAILETFT
jgi:hypothetical protein